MLAGTIASIFNLIKKFWIQFVNLFYFNLSGRINGNDISRLKRSPSPRREDRRSRSRSPVDSDRRFQSQHFSRRSTDSRSPSPSREEIYSAARFAAEHAIKLAEAERSRKSPPSPSRDRSSSPIRRTATSTEKMTNGFLNNQGLPPSSGIAAALQNALQAGQSSSMQQVTFFFSFFFPFLIFVINPDMALSLSSCIL